MWITDPQLAAIDGVALLADGAVYVNTFISGQLFRIPVNADGSAGTMVPIETSMPLDRPDGLRTVGPQTLIQAEGQGRVTELTIKGNRAEVRVLQEGLTAASGVTVVGEHRPRPRRAGKGRRGAVSPAVTGSDCCNPAGDRASPYRLSCSSATVGVTVQPDRLRPTCLWRRRVNTSGRVDDEV